MMSRLQRWGNRAAVAACAVPIHTWLWEGNFEIRLKCFRELSLPHDADLPEGETSRDEMVSKCLFLVTEFLLNFARGKVAEGEVDHKGDKKVHRAKPYGVNGSKQRVFCSLSSTLFGVTLVTLYPFLCEDREQWNLRIQGKLGNFTHPASGL